MKYIHRYRFVLFAFCLWLLSGGCEKEKIGHKEEEVHIDLDLTTNPDCRIVTRASYEGTPFTLPEANEFKVQLYNATGELLKEWTNYSAVPRPIKVQATKFRIKASCGNPEKSGFDCPSFVGDTLIQVRAAKEKRVILNTSFANALASVHYREGLKNHYQDYSTLIIAAEDTVTFGKEEKRTAFFPAGKLQVVLNLSKDDTTRRTIAATTIPQAKAGEYYRFHIDIEGGQGYEKLLISFDSTATAQPIEIELSQDWQAHKKPYLTPAFDTTAEHSYLVGVSCSPGTLQSLITAVGRIGSCKIRTASPDLIAKGWPAEVDLLKLTEATQNRLKKFGLKWSENMANANMAELDFSGIVANLPAGDQMLTVQVADIYGQLSNVLPLRFSIVPPEFRLLEPETPAIARSLEYTFKVHMNGGNPNKVHIEYFNDYPAFGVEEWTDCTIHERQWDDANNEVTIRAKVNINKASMQFRAKYDTQVTNEITLKAINPTFQLNKEYPEWAHRVKLYIKQTDGTNGLVQNSLTDQYFIETSLDGVTWEESAYNGTTIDKTDNSIKIQADSLAAGQTYYVRAGFDSKTGLEVCYSEPIAIQTEEAAQLPNAGMEDWYSNKITEDGIDLSQNSLVYWNKWYPWIENNSTTKGWNTVNKETTQFGATPSSFLGAPTKPYVGCCYTTTSGTLRTEDKFNGNYAALIRTVGWGIENSAAASGTNKMGTCQNVTPGQLYLGTYDAINKVPIYGYPFTSRPNKLKFYYKYKPKNKADYGCVEIKILDNSGNILAHNFKNLTKQDAYSAIELPLDYNNRSTIKAASMYIVFKSSANSDCWEANTTNLTPPPARNLSDGEYVGSQLYIDDIELIYE